MKNVTANDVDTNNSITINFLLVILFKSQEMNANAVEKPMYNKES